ncbi:cysteine desulfurase family protein [Patescibacteria group bacterium]
MSKPKRVYLDHAATTPVDPEVLRRMLPYFSKRYGNPAVLYSLGREATKAIDKAKKQVAKVINANPEEIFFTNGASDSEEKALVGIARRFQKRSGRLISSRIEHPSLLKILEGLGRDGFEVRLLSVNQDGIINLEGLKRLVTKGAILASFSHSNSEIGTIQPVNKIGEIAKKRDLVYHLDVAQTIGYLPIDVKKLGVDLLSFGVHKIYGPKGVGILFVKKGIPVFSEESRHKSRRFRMGTENVPGIVGAGMAVELMEKRRRQESKRLAILRNYFTNIVLDRIPGVFFTGHPRKRHPAHISFCFSCIEGEAAVLMLDSYGISVATGSACSTGDTKLSHVLKSLKVPSSVIRGSLRFTLGKESTKEKIDYTVDVLEKVVRRLRKMIPDGLEFDRNTVGVL